MGQSSVLRRREEFAVDAENIIGWKVENPDGENLGTVQNVVIDPLTREVTRVVVAFGGFLGLGAQRYAVPPRALSARPDRRVLLLPADRATIKEQAAAWDVHEEAPPAPEEGTTLFLPSGRAESSALRVDLELPEDIISGETFSEEIRVTNVSPQTLDRVVVRQDIDAHFKMEPARGAVVKSGELVWDVGTLAPGEARSLRVSGRAEGAERLRACCRASYEQSVCAVRSVVAPKLELDVDAPRECLVCDEIPVEIRARNTGNATLRDVELHAALPEGLAPADGEERERIDVLEPGESTARRLRLKPARRGEYTLSARATGGRATARGSAHIAVREPVLTILPGTSTELFAGAEGRIEFLVKNVGDGPARNTVAEATASGAARLRESRWEMGTLAPGESKAIAAALEAAEVGSTELALRARGDCAREVAARARLEVKGVPALLLECVDSPDPVRVGERATYTIAVVNQGSATLTNLRLRGQLEDSMALDGSEGPTRAQGGRAGLEFEPLASLPPKEKAVWRVVVKALKPADARFKATLVCDQIARTVEETESTHFFR